MPYFGVAHPGRAARSVMDKEIVVSARALKQLDKLLEEYIGTVEDSLMTPSSQRTYIDQAGFFVRWVRGEFVPGETLE
jgi:hypothetical protein